MHQPQKNISSTLTSGYRYSFNGMETDHEVSGHGNSYTTQFRQYDPRLGRWKSLDPLASEYIDVSPYTGMDNNPNFFVDPNGMAPEAAGGRRNDKSRASEPGADNDDGRTVTTNEDGSTTVKWDTGQYTVTTGTTTKNRTDNKQSQLRESISQNTDKTSDLIDKSNVGMVTSSGGDPSYQVRPKSITEKGARRVQPGRVDDIPIAYGPSPKTIRYLNGINRYTLFAPTLLINEATVNTSAMTNVTSVMRVKVRGLRIGDQIVITEFTSNSGQQEPEIYDIETLWDIWRYRKIETGLHVNDPQEGTSTSVTIRVNRGTNNTNNTSIISRFYTNTHLAGQRNPNTKRKARRRANGFR